MDAELPGRSDQVRKRCGFHLSPDLSALNLDRYFARAEFSGDLLVEQSSHDQPHHVALAWREQLMAGM
jgi:hypothetical protein